MIALLSLVFVGYLLIKSADDAVQMVVFEKLPGYAGILWALIVWLQSVDEFGYSLGSFTFSFLFKMMGSTLPQGMHDRVATSAGPTNIFLIYRGLLADFGMAGAASLMFLFGFTIMQSSLSRPTALRYLLLRSALLMTLFLICSVFTTVAAAFFISYVLILVERLEWPTDGRARRPTPIDTSIRVPVYGSLAPE